MQKSKKIVGVVLTLVLVVSMLSGCSDNGQKSAEETTAANSSSTEATPTSVATATDTAEKDTTTDSQGKYTIGYNYFASASYALLTLANNAQVAIDAFGNKAVAMNDEMSIEKIVQDVENMIASDCDGLVLWLPIDSLYPTISKMCEDAKVPFVLSDKVPSDPAIIEQLKANPYFVGAVAPANDIYGQKIAEFALNKGYKTCIVSASSVGDASDTPRLETFKKVFEEAGGTILTELHSVNGDEVLTQIDDALVAYDTPDFIYGVGSDYGIIAAASLNNAGKDAAVLTSGLDRNALELLVTGDIEMINGDAWVSGMYATVLLQNYLDGTPLKDADGNVAWIDNVQPFEVPAETYNLYNQFFLKEFSYSPEEIQQMSGKNNPNFTYDAFVKAISDYSLQNRLIVKCKEGKVTAEELSKVGITVE